MLALSSCRNEPQEELKGISVDQLSDTEGVADSVGEGVPAKVVTRPSDVLLTAHADHRLVTVNRLMQHSSYRGGKTYLGSNYYYSSSDYEEEEGYPRLNAWHGHYMPGIEAVRGVNLLNISHYNMNTKTKHDLFELPVWVNTLYYPAFETDTLNGKPVMRDYYMVSAYDEDTNKDSILNYHDLRRFYLFDLEGKRLAQLVPPNYSVVSSEYDPANDAMFVYASLDENANGKRDVVEPVHVFWFSLKAPAPGERLY
ncbi:MAG: hypothetical protein IPN76_29140 [Saprospiraceae bacterium]|nr:hypothetical protein [Saprospiraceae bacterium]